MIDPKIFSIERLVDCLIGYSNSSPENIWIKDCEILLDKRNYVVIKHEPENNSTSYLRYSKGPRQGYFWDCYGEDFINFELALIALSRAPIPPFLIERS